MLRGLHVQPHSTACRARMETNLEKDIRVRNARVRMQERTRRSTTRSTTDDEVGEAKRRRLEDIEEKAMEEEDPDKLTDLFKRYREEYERDRGGNGEAVEEQVKKQIKVDGMQELASGSGGAAVYEEMTIGEVNVWDYLEQAAAQAEGGLEQAGPQSRIGDGGDEALMGEEFEEEEYAWDDVNNAALPLNLVKQARAEEMGHMKNKIFRVVKREEAIKAGRTLLSTKWVDTDKSHGVGEPVVRSRWVARDFKDPRDKDREDLFSATPPLELMRFVLSRQATRRKDGIPRKTLYLDVKKAHVQPLCEKEVYVELPEEAGVGPDECGKLIHWLYGCREAAQAWEEHYSALLIKEGFERLVAVPVAFVHKERDLLGVVHGDDFVWEGRDRDLDWVLRVLKGQYELKDRGRLGPGPNDTKRVEMLGRVIEYGKEGITWSGDPRHLKLLESHFGMNEQTKALGRNGYEEEDKDDDEEGDLSKAEIKTYRMLAARLNYMAQDHAWLQFPAKEVCRRMAKPRVRDFEKIKRIVRFLKGVGTVKLHYRWQEEEQAQRVTVFVDSDWAGCRATRKSTSGGVMKIGDHVVKTWSRTQPTIATSSGEAELIAMQEGATRGMGMQTIMEEIGLAPRLEMIRVYTDSAAAKSFVATRGLGKMRHVEVKLLWMQEAVRRGRLLVGKVLGTANVADSLTKYHNVGKLVELWGPHGVEMQGERGPA